MADKIRINGVKYHAPVGKRLVLNKDGNGLEKSTLMGPRSGPGEVINRCFATAEEAFKYRLSATSETMFVTGTFDPNCGATIVLPSARLIAATMGSEQWPVDSFVALTKDYLAFRKERGLISIDIDPCKADTAYPNKPSILETPDEVRAAVLALLPEAKAAPMLVLPSSSSLIENADTGQLLSGAGGWRVLLVTSDASLTPKVLETIHLRAWISMKGCYAYVSKSGAVLPRSLADQALGRPTQPDFPTADLGEGLRKVDGSHKMFCVDGPDFDPSSIAERPTRAAEARLKMDAARRKLRPEADATKGRAMADHAERLQRSGIPAELAERTAHARYKAKHLVGSDMIEFDDGKSVPVAELMGPRGADLDGKTCPDPLEPDYDGGRSVAKFYWNEGKQPGIFSFARGEQYYQLRHDLSTACAAIKDANGVYNAIVRIIALSELDPLETDLIYKEACKSLGLGRKSSSLKGAVTAWRAANVPPKDDVSLHPRDEDESYASFVPIEKPIPSPGFPQTKLDRDGRLVTLDHGDNVEYLLNSYGITFRYDEICKEIAWTHPNLASTGDNSDSGLLSQVIGICNLNGVPTKNLRIHMTAIADRRSFNPVTEYLKSKNWDKKPRFEKFAADLGATDPQIARIAARVFLLQACAAADHAVAARAVNPEARPHFENVVVFVGAQGIGKTKGIARLLPAPLRSYLKEGMVLDPKNKDLVKQAVSSWVTELGELDATFRKSDIEALKGFLSNGRDELRMPYAETTSRFLRRTVFVGTVNDEAFLADRTGNRRFLPLKIGRFSFSWSDDELDQLWAEAWSRYISGEAWWPNAEEEALLRENADKFRTVGWIEEMLNMRFDWTGPLPDKLKRMTATEILMSSTKKNDHSVRQPTQKDLSDVAALMKRMWSSHPSVVCVNGDLFLGTDRGNLPVHTKGGKANGWLVPNPCDASFQAQGVARKLEELGSPPSKLVGR
ncbi:hypothetical protein ACSSVY_001329 [Roseovarius sp. MBR-51]